MPIPFFGGVNATEINKICPQSNTIKYRKFKQSLQYQSPVMLINAISLSQQCFHLIDIAVIIIAIVIIT